jgi:hypothetical protein
MVTGRVVISPLAKKHNDGFSFNPEMDYLVPFISIPAIIHGTMKQASSSTSWLPLEWYGYKKRRPRD